MNTRNFPTYAPSILRIGLASVYLWFGFQQFLHTMMWTSYVPTWIVSYSPVDVVTLVHINGAIELVFGFALLFGIFTRVSAFVLGFHMAHITLIVGYDATGIRDLGLTIATFACAFFGRDMFGVDGFIYSLIQEKADKTLSEPAPLTYGNTLRQP